MPAQPFPLTWNVDVLEHGRNQCLAIASEEYTLFSFLLPAGSPASVDSFLIPFRQRLFLLLGDIAGQPASDAVKFSNRTNRRVIGSQNDLLYLTHQLLKDVDKPASPALLQRIEALLNSTPMSYLNMDCPDEALAKHLVKLKQGGD